MSTLYIIDANSFLYRAYYAYSGMSDSKGRPTGAIHGFTRLLLKLMDKDGPDYAAIVSGRRSMPPDLTEQLPDIREIIKAFGIAHFQSKKHSSDDIIASMARHLKGPGLDIYIASSTEGILQLAAPGIKIISPDTRPRPPKKETQPAEKLPALNSGIPVRFSLEALMPRRLDERRLSAILLEYELVELSSDLKKRKKEPRISYKTIMTGEELSALAGKLKSAGEFAVDTETTSPEPVEAELVGISVSIRPKEGFYIPLGHKYPGAPPQISAESLRAAFSGVFLDASVKKIGQNIKYDYIVLKNFGLPLEGISFDTMVASYLLNPAGGHNNLDDMALRYLNYKTMSFSELTQGYPVKSALSQVPVEKVTEYACEDADITMRLKDYLSPRLKQMGLEDLFGRTEMPLVKVLADMQLKGVLVDRGILQGLKIRISKELGALEDEIYRMAQERFNINSHEQLGRVLFEKLKIPAAKRTKAGFSTQEAVLQKLAGKYPIVKKILDYRRLSSIKSTHIEGLLALINSRTGRLHANFNQTIAATGRLTSSRPNLQNVPAHSDIAGYLRRAFIADEGYCLLSSDYSQIELRILAHLSKDAALTEAFNKGIDIHRQTASRVFSLPPEEVTDRMRKKAKAVIFGIVYGITDSGLARQLDISRQEASELIKLILMQYPGVKMFVRESISRARKDGFVTTMLNRRRYLPQITSLNDALRAAAEREAVNTPIQGSAADLIKTAMIEIDRNLRRDGLDAFLVLQIHDELVLEVSRRQLKEVAQVVRSCMENAIKLAVPVEVNMSAGNNWQDMKSISR